MEGLRAAGGRVLVGGWTALVPPSGVPPSKIADPSPGNSMGPEGRLHWETKRGTWDQDFANLGQCCKSCQSWAGRQWAKILLILLFCLPVWGARLQVRLLILQSCNLASVHDGGEGRVLKSCNPATCATCIISRRELVQVAQVAQVAQAVQVVVRAVQAVQDFKIAVPPHPIVRTSARLARLYRELLAPPPSERSKLACNLAPLPKNVQKSCRPRSARLTARSWSDIGPL